MTYGERVKEIRKFYNLTLEKFGDRIGMKKNSVSQIENGKNSLTEQTIKSICREFNVDYIWLTTGKGEMLISCNDNDEFFKKIELIMAGENETRKNFIKSCVDCTDEDLDAFQRFIDIFKNYEQQKKD